MLEQILDHIHNYFEKEIRRGTFTISGGAMDVDFLQDGQYFRIVGSVFNDGVHKYPEFEDLHDEVFEGEVWAMAVPPAVVALADEVEQWVSKNPSSPFTSESFAGYSYTRASGQGGTPMSWEDNFRSRLNRWRKIA